MKHEEAFRGQARGQGGEHEVRDGGIAPGKRTATQGMRGADPVSAVMRGLGAAEAGIGAVRAQYLPAMRAAVGRREMPEARMAGATLTMALARIDAELATARRWATVAESAGAVSLIAPLEAARDALREEAAPVLALAPPAAPMLPLADTFDFAANADAAPAHEAAEAANRETWGAQLDAAEAPAGGQVIDARDRFGAEAVQRRATGACDADDVHAHAQAGVAGTGGALPHREQIQASFGAHDVSGIRAHVGGPAAAASDAIGAEAYATGNDVAFATAPTLFVAAHEAAHVVQQRAGVSLLGGVGEAGDSYEQHADAVAEKVVRGESAEGLLGEVGSAGTGNAVQRFDPTGAVDSIVKGSEERQEEQTKAAEADRRKAIENESSQDKRRRGFLLNDLESQSMLGFEQLEAALEGAEDGLENVPAKTASSLELVDLAAAFAIGGTSGFVALKAAGIFVSGTEAKVLGDAIKESVKTAFKAGMVESGSSTEGDLRKCFFAAQRNKIRKAKSEFIHLFWSEKAEALYFKPLEELEQMADAAAARAQDDDIVVAHEQSTAIAWINFVAQARHGAFVFDHWADPRNGGGYEDYPTETARETPDETDEERDEFERGSVDPEGVWDLVNDDSQRPMQGAHFGLLEVHVQASAGGNPDKGDRYLYLDIVGHPGYGVRMDNINEYAKGQLRKLGTIGKAPVNKIVRVYFDLELNPPQPDAAFLVTADGYVRAESWYGHLSDEDTLQIVEFVNGHELACLE